MTAFAAFAGAFLALTVQLLVNSSTVGYFYEQKAEFGAGSFAQRRRRTAAPPRPGATELASSPPVPPPPPPPAPLWPPIAFQPEALRRAPAPAVDMHCNEPLATESVTTTRAALRPSMDGTGSLRIFAHSSYRGREHVMEDGDLGYAFDYRIEITNEGLTSVQLLTRHLVFVDELGSVDEVKGPGASGEMPTIAAGGTWAYRSVVRLATSRGSMHGSFQFEVPFPAQEGAPDGAPPAGEASAGQMFNANVGRFALSMEQRAELVPCGEVHTKERTPVSGDEHAPATAAEPLPLTSVWVTERIIAGAVVEHNNDEADEADVGRFSFTLDVQLNNAGSDPVLIGRTAGYTLTLPDPRMSPCPHVGAADGPPLGSGRRQRAEVRRRGQGRRRWR